MPRPKLSIPTNYDPCDNVLVSIPTACIPMVGGLFALLEWRASWIPEHYDDGLQIAMLLQERLGMSECENTITAAIDALRECVCGILASLNSGSANLVNPGIPEGWPTYDEQPSNVVVDVGPPPEGFSTWDEWKVYRCQAVQHMVVLAHDLVHMINRAVFVGQTLGWALLMTSLIALGVTAPFVLVILVAAVLVSRAMDSDFDAQEQWITDHYSDLVCAIITADTVSQAKSNVLAVFEQWPDEIGSSDLPMLIYSTSALNDLFDGSLVIPSGVVYDPDLCDCDEPLEGSICSSPIDTSIFTGDFYDGSTFIGLGGGSYPDCTYPNAFMPIYDHVFDGTYNVRCTISWNSGYGFGATTGTASLIAYDPLTQEWVLIHSYTAVTLEDALTMHNHITDREDPIDLSGYTRYQVTLAYQPGACRSTPALALNVYSICFTLSQVE